MILFIENCIIKYPSNYIYPEQIQLMYVLKKIFDNKIHGLMGVPAGMGLSFTIFVFYLSNTKKVYFILNMQLSIRVAEIRF